MTTKLSEELASDHYIGICFWSSKTNFTVSLFTMFRSTRYHLKLISYIGLSFREQPCARLMRN